MTSSSGRLGHKQGEINAFGIIWECTPSVVVKLPDGLTELRAPRWTVSAGFCFHEELAIPSPFVRPQRRRIRSPAADASIQWHAQKDSRANCEFYGLGLSSSKGPRSPLARPSGTGVLKRHDRYRRFSDDLLVLELVNRRTTLESSAGAATQEPGGFKKTAETLAATDQELNDRFEALKAFLSALATTCRRRH